VILKKKKCYVARNYNEELTNFVNQSYELPDGQTISISEASFMCSEGLFNPTLMDSSNNAIGVHKLTTAAIDKCDIDIRDTFYNNIVLAGGTTMFRGLKERLEQEVNNIVPRGLRVQIHSEAQSKYATWRGAAILSATCAWIFTDEYNEVGPSIVHRKCW